jgi:hypothetical protein
MFIPRIRHASPKVNSPASRRRRRLQRVIHLEQLEIRRPLSAGLGAGGGVIAPPAWSNPGANAVIDGPSVWLGSVGPTARPAAAPAFMRSETPSAPEDFGLAGFSTWRIGTDGLRSESVFAASVSSVSIVSQWTGSWMTQDGNSAMSTVSDGLTTLSGFSSPGYFLRFGTTSELVAFSYESDAYFAASTGIPGFAAITLASTNNDLIVIFGGGSIGWGSPAHWLAPDGGMDFASRDAMGPPTVGPGNIGPPAGAFDQVYGFALASPVVPGVALRLETSSNDVDPNPAVSVSSASAGAIGSLQIMAIPIAGGRAAIAAPVQTSGAGIAVQVDHSNGLSGSGWMSYVVGGDWSSGAAQLSGFSLDEPTTTAPSADDGTSPAAITDGNAPLSVLLTGPEVPTQTSNNDLEQIAELIPPSESSLALVATLWSVPSDNSTIAHREQTFDASPFWLTDSVTTRPWAQYLIGLDQAFDQTRGEIHQFVSNGEHGLILTERDQVELDRQLEWERPIMPVSTTRVSDRDKSSLGDTASVIDNDTITAIAADRVRSELSAESALQTREDEDAGRSEAVLSFVTAASFPLLSALSASTAITGWLWTRRKRKLRPGLAGPGVL